MCSPNTVFTAAALDGYLDSVEDWRETQFKRLKSHAGAHNPIANIPLPLDATKQEMQNSNVFTGWVYSYHRRLRKGWYPSVCTYLDYVGAALYPERLLERYFNYLSQTILQNPHSDSSMESIIDAIRLQVLKLFNASPETYAVIFTAGATDSLRIVAQSFPFCKEGIFAYTIDAHTSTVGIRSEAIKKGAAVWALPFETDQYVDELVLGIPPPYNSNETSFVDTKIELPHESLIELTSGSSLPFPPSVTHISKPNFSQMATLSDRLREKTAVDTIAKGGTVVSKASDASVSTTNSDNPSTSRDKLGSEVVSASKNLLAVTGESNYSGQIANLEPLRQLVLSKLSDTLEGKRNWWVLLDAAALAASKTIDLEETPVDFMVLSFYKLFGFPTGLGALIVRQATANSILSPTYFGGGTIDALSAYSPFVELKQSIVGRLEHGTPNFHAILCLPFAIEETYGRFTQQRLFRHMMAVTRYAVIRMKELRHKPLLKLSAFTPYNFHNPLKGHPVCTIFGNHDASNWLQTQGPVIAFLVHYSEGSVVPYTTVYTLAKYVWNIHLRVGCHCNMGGCHANLHISDARVQVQADMGHTCSGTAIGLEETLPTGCIRISFGYASVKADVDRFILFLATEFLNRMHPFTLVKTHPITAPHTCAYDLDASKQSTHTCAYDVDASKHSVHTTTPNMPQPASLFPLSKGALHSITFYPIKGCRGISPPVWFMDRFVNGLLWDRQFGLEVLETSGKMRCISQTYAPKLALVRTDIVFAMDCETAKAPVGSLQLSPLLLITFYPTERNTIKDPLLGITPLCISLCTQEEMNQIGFPAFIGLLSGSSVSTAFWKPFLYPRIGTAFTKQLNRSLQRFNALYANSMSHSKTPENGRIWLLPISAFSIDQQAYGAPFNGTHRDGSKPNAVTGTIGEVTLYAQTADCWFESVLGLKVHMAAAAAYRGTDGTEGDRIVRATSTSNSSKMQQLQPTFKKRAPFLLVSADTLAYMQTYFTTSLQIERFRPNFVVEGLDAFTEKLWKQLTIGTNHFIVEGECVRCASINISPLDAKVDPQVFRKFAMLSSAFHQKIAKTNANHLAYLPKMGILLRWDAGLSEKGNDHPRFAVIRSKCRILDEKSRSLPLRNTVEATHLSIESTS